MKNQREYLFSDTQNKTKQNIVTKHQVGEVQEMHRTWISFSICTYDFDSHT